MSKQKQQQPASAYHPLFPYLPTTESAVLAPGELVIDNFAGLGGASTGIERALGRPVDVAINHDRNAVELHTRNHPYTRHYVEDVWQVDPLEVTKGQPVALAWFSPDCKHFSKAKGGRPVEKKIRGLAWVALRWAALTRPRVIMLENVEEFQTWGPLTREGQPCPTNKGRTFRSFVNALRRHGYEVEWRELRACDYGAPTIRKRLFLIARRDGAPIVWPSPTHGDPKSAAVRAGHLKAWRTAAECLDWTLPTPSIFERKKALVEATNRRIAKGIQKFVLDTSEPFIVRTDMHSSNSGCVYDKRTPLTTITTALGHAVVDPVVAPFVTNKQYDNVSRSAGLPLSTVTTNHNKNELVTGYLVPRYGERPEQSARAVSIEAPLPTVVPTENGSRLAVAMLTKFQQHSVGQSLPAPLDTVMAGATRFGAVLATAHLMQDNSGRTRPEDANWSVDRPNRTIAAQGGRMNLVTCFVTKFRTGSTGHPATEPLHTITAGGDSKRDAGAAHAMGVVSGAIVGLGSRAAQARPRGLNEPLGTTLAKPDRAIASVWLQTYYGAKRPGDARGSSLNEPVRTQTTENRHALTAATLVQYNGTSDAQTLTEPARTIPTRDRFGLTMATLMRQFGTSTAANVAAPLGTITTEGAGKTGLVTAHASCGLDEVTLASARRVTAFLLEYLPVGALDGHVDETLGIVVVQFGAETFALVDIGMRMLTPRELAACQGFASGYILDATLDGRKLSKADQVRGVGNSVCPDVAAALVRANLTEMPREEAAD